jgi:endonuclease/exonuclease/phosphatase family metal-dependent hydrolase
MDFINVILQMYQQFYVHIQQNINVMLIRIILSKLQAMRLQQIKYSFLLLCVIALVGVQSCKTTNGACIAFYNVENLFDTINDPNKNDEQFLPEGDYKWSEKRYLVKLEHLAKVIGAINDGSAPDILGLCEVENKRVLQDLLSLTKLRNEGYEIVHYESPDARGIDVALLYRKSMFKLKKANPNQLNLDTFNTKTRDILYAKLQTRGKIKENLHVLVNHWPSRWGGKAKSEPKRLLAAKKLRALRDSIIQKSEAANIVIIGDFNDETFDKSIKEVLGTTDDIKNSSNEFMYNAMARLAQSGLGSYNYRDNWNMLDQIIVSPGLLDNQKGEYKEFSANIFSPDWLRQHGGKYDQYPFRTFGGRKYLNGYSDHFAVSILLTFNQN